MSRLKRFASRLSERTKDTALKDEYRLLGVLGRGGQVTPERRALLDARAHAAHAHRRASSFSAHGAAAQPQTTAAPRRLSRSTSRPPVRCALCRSEGGWQGGSESGGSRRWRWLRWRRVESVSRDECASVRAARVSGVATGVAESSPCFDSCVRCCCCGVCGGGAAHEYAQRNGDGAPAEGKPTYVAVKRVRVGGEPAAAAPRTPGTARGALCARRIF